MSNGTKLKIAVIDGMGGNIGHQIVSQLRVHLVAAARVPLPHLMEEAINKVRQLLEIDEEVKADV